VSDRERLQRGREKHPRPKPTRSGKQAAELDGASRFTRYVERRRRRRAAKKARIRAMTRSRRYLRRLMIAITWLLGMIAALMVAVIVLYAEFTDVPRPESLPLPQKATIQYADGSTLATIGSVDRTIVHLAQVPESARWAVLAAEDRGFYTESAVSIKGTIRAALSDITGGSTQGGSGITQQYVKNAYLSNEQTLTRKLKELMIAVKLSREYSKDQILEFYLNTVYFGRGAYGIQAAAQAYFGENVEKLTTAQGALLAALLRAPSYYDPANNPDAAKSRWFYVLDGMVKTGHLSSAEESTLKFPTTRAPGDTGLGTTGWKYLLVNEVLADLQAHGISEKEVYARGLTIRTTIDPRAQQDALQAISDTFTGLTPKQRNLKNALVAVNPNTGAVLAYYGGSGPGVPGYDGKVNFNDWAGVAAHPAGSAFKPYTLATVLTQTLKQTPGKDHVAINSYVNGSFCLPIQGTTICNDPSDKSDSSPSLLLSQAMKYSLNTTFDLLASDAGPNEVAATAHAMGISKTDSYGNPTLVDSNGQTSFGIGIGDYPVTPLDQASGFSTLANGGLYNPPYLVEKAISSDGQVVYSHSATPARAIDARVANDVTMTLEPVASWSGLPLNGGRQSAAKTGTEGIQGDTHGNNSDAWMVGFTPQVSAAVWVGTGYHVPIYNAEGLPMYGRNAPGLAWQEFMNLYLSNQPNLPLPSSQLISATGGTPAPSPTPTPTPTPTSSSPTPTFSVTSGFPSSPSNLPTPSSSITFITPSRTPTPTVSCSPALLGQSCATVTPGPGG
jgi:membrane peptidoglycan carboxypeptidase